jgi:hypothetical protein
MHSSQLLFPSLHHFRHMWLIFLRPQIRYINTRFPRKSKILALTKLVLMLLFTGHIMSCAWYYVGSLSFNGWVKVPLPVPESQNPQSQTLNPQPWTPDSQPFDFQPRTLPGARALQTLSPKP